MWDCINGSGFRCRRPMAAIYHISISNRTTIQYHWGEFFPHYSANRMYFQLEIKVGIFKEEFSFFFSYSLPVLHITFKCTVWHKTLFPLSSTKFCVWYFSAEKKHGIQLDSYLNAHVSSVVADIGYSHSSQPFM